jgi:hypothetical protein
MRACGESGRYDSRVKAMEVDERPTEEYTDIGGLDKQIQELVEAIVLPITHKDRFKALGIKAPKGAGEASMVVSDMGRGADVRATGHGKDADGARVRGAVKGNFPEAGRAAAGSGIIIVSYLYSIVLPMYCVGRCVCVE